MDNIIEKHNTPLVSVIVCTYNRSSLLRRALQSIFIQNYPNLEVIIIDDYSMDNTREIVETFKEKHSNISYLRNDKNKGLSFSRNRGISICRGSYIATMDDDDEWIDNEKITKQIKIFNNTNNEKLAIVSSAIQVNKYNGETYVINYFKDKTFKRRILQGNGIIHTSTVLIYKDIIDKIGGFDEKIYRGVDSDLYRKVILNGYDIIFLNEISTRYYIHPGDRITKMKNERHLLVDMKSRLRTLLKYWKAYLKDPISFLYHIRYIIKDIYGLLRLWFIKIIYTNKLY